MALRSARSTARQRQNLATLEKTLTEALESADQRFFLTDADRRAYERVLAHAQIWRAWESEEARHGKE